MDEEGSSGFVEDETRRLGGEEEENDLLVLDPSHVSLGVAVPLMS